MRRIAGLVLVLLTLVWSLSAGLAGAATRVQAWSANLDSLATVAPSANTLTMLDNTFAQWRTDLSLVVGTNVQAYDVDLTSYATVAPSANTLTMLDDTYAQWRAAIGAPGFVLAPGSDFTSSSATPSAISGCSFTPIAAKHYAFDVAITGYTAATTTGMILEIDPGNVQNGAAFLNAQGTSAASNQPNRGSLASGVVSVIGLTAPTSPARTLTFANGTFQAHATAPTAFAVNAGSEIGGSLVTIPAGECSIRYTVLD